MPDGDLATCRRRFADFGRHLMASAPLYATLSDGISRDDELSGLLLVAPPGQRQPVLLFACVHWLLLNDVDDPLAGWYPNLNGGASPRGGELEAFARFCRDRDAELRLLLATRSTQTNEIGRSSLFLPAFGVLNDECGPLTRIDVGASAGLNLLSNHFHYEYEPGGPAGPESAVRLHCGTRGDVPIPTTLPHFAAAIGIDPHPVDVRDPDQARWLEACVWPDEVERFRRLNAAIAIAREVGVDVRRGNAVDDIEGLLDEMTVSGAGHVVVTSSWVMNYLSAGQRVAFVEAIGRAAATRDVSWIYAENPALCPELFGAPDVSDNPNLPTALVIVRWRAGRQTAAHVAQCHPHGRWLHWRG